MRRTLGPGDWLGLRLGSRAKAPLAGLALLAGAFLLLGLSAPAAGLTIDPNPVLFDNGSVSGSITLVETTTGVPSGGNVLAGSVSGTDLSLVFEVTMDVGSDALGTIGVGVSEPGPFFPIPVDSTGAGDVAGTGDVGISGVSGPADTRIFAFDGGLGSGQTSDRFFVSYASLSEGWSVNFMIGPAEGSQFTVTSTLVAVPEASAALLLLAGVGAAALAARRGRHAA
jgi:hypothetical protein